MPSLRVGAFGVLFMFDTAPGRVSTLKHPWGYRLKCPLRAQLPAACCSRRRLQKDQTDKVDTCRTAVRAVPRVVGRRYFTKGYTESQPARCVIITANDRRSRISRQTPVDFPPWRKIGYVTAEMSSAQE